MLLRGFNEKDAPDVLTAIKRTLRVLEIAALTQLAGLLGISLYALNQASTSHDALCQFRESVARQVAQSEHIIATKPEIIKQFGLTLQQVQAQIARQQDTVDSLSDLGC